MLMEKILSINENKQVKITKYRGDGVFSNIFLIRRAKKVVIFDRSQAFETRKIRAKRES